MFGVIVSGRLVQTNFEAVGSNQVITTIPDADSINHIVVFLTGQEAFPEGMCGVVFFSWPDPNAPPTWLPLGFISNEKPSAIFKISSLKKDSSESQLQVQSTFGSRPISVHNAQIGISIEPTVNMVNYSWQATHSKPASNFIEECPRKILENFFNYAYSFVVNQSNMIPNPNESYIPLTALKNWYCNFERKLKINPLFWQ